MGLMTIYLRNPVSCCVSSGIALGYGRPHHSTLLVILLRVGLVGVSISLLSEKKIRFTKITLYSKSF